MNIYCKKDKKQNKKAKEKIVLKIKKYNNKIKLKIKKRKIRIK